MNFLKQVKNLFFGSESPDDDDARRQRRQGGEGAGPSTAAPKRPRSSGASPNKPAATVAGPKQLEPVLRDAGYSGSGGVQGLDWYAASQLQDQHGDFANGFFDADGGMKGGGAATVAAAAAAVAAGKQRRGPPKWPGKPAAGGGPDATGKSSQLKIKDVQQGTVILEPV